jgi:hypothetical protein
VPGENVEDQLRAINDPAVHFLFEVTLLGGREVLAEDDESSVSSPRLGTDLFEFAPTNQVSGVERISRLGAPANHNPAGAMSELS